MNLSIPPDPEEFDPTTPRLCAGVPGGVPELLLVPDEMLPRSGDPLQSLAAPLREILRAVGVEVIEGIPFRAPLRDGSTRVHPFVLVYPRITRLLRTLNQLPFDQLWGLAQTLSVPELWRNEGLFPEGLWFAPTSVGFCGRWLLMAERFYERVARTPGPGELSDRMEALAILGTVPFRVLLRPDAAGEWMYDPGDVMDVLRRCAMQSIQARLLAPGYPERWAHLGLLDPEPAAPSDTITPADL